MNKIIICFVSFAVAGNFGASISFKQSRVVVTRYDRDYMSEITPSANTHWGDWGEVDFCPEGSFAKGFAFA